MNETHATAQIDAAKLVREVRRLELRTRRLVDSRFSGEYHSVFKGQGIEFAEVREYQPGDDVRTIDWNVTARLGAPYIKRYVEERELTVLLAIDLSGSQRWGTVPRFKAELALEVAATLALSAVRNNDRVGLLAFTDRIEHSVRARKGRRHTLRLLRDVIALQPAGRATDLALPLNHLLRGARSRTVLFLFSDFQLDGDWSEFERALARTAVRHDVVPVRLIDPNDLRMADVGLLSLVDPETGEQVLVDTSSRAIRRRFESVVQQEALRADRLFQRLGLDTITLHADEPYDRPLLEFFRRRERRLHR
jgi:uncharacterized protein (DUF58 family)